MQGDSLRMEACMEDLRFKRVLIKLSGEALAGEQGFGIRQETVQEICKELGEVLDYGV